MDEQQWLTSDDPVAMLRYLETGRLPESMGANYPMQPCRVRVSDRKLRLWVEACRQFTASRSLIPVQWEANLDDPLVLHDCLATWAVGEETAHSMEESEKAALLRDIVGDPFRPVTLPRGRQRCVRCEGDGWNPSEDGWGVRDKCKVCSGRGYFETGPCSWLTPTVRSLAEAAYDLRVGRECGRCGGRRFLGGVAPGQHGWIGAPECPDCHGTGRIADGTLDPDRLAVLADALEEAGCDSADILNHLRGTVHEYNDGGTAYWYTDTSGAQLTPGRASEAHSHVRGCWALDLCLGRE